MYFNILLQLISNESLIGDVNLQTLSNAGITGAGLIFAIYTFILPIPKEFFEPRLIEHKNNLEKFQKMTKNNDSTTLLENYDEFIDTGKKTLKTSKLPEWVDKKIIYSFIGFLLTSITSSLISSFKKYGYLEYIPISLYIVSLLLFLIVGYSGLNYICDVLKIKYEKLIKEIKDIQIQKIQVPEIKDVQIQKIQTPEIKETLKFPCTFEKDTLGDIPKAWSIVTKEAGKILVTDEIPGANNTNKCLKIYNPKDSSDVIGANIEPKSTFNITFFIRQAIYGEGRGTGIGLMFNNQKTQAIWLAIREKHLNGYWENAYRTMHEIELNKWYKIRLEINCNNSEYVCIIDDNYKYDGRFRNPVQQIDRINTPGWKQQGERLGYIDEISLE